MPLTDIRYQPRQSGQRAVSQRMPQYMPARWRGFSFFCESTSDEFGRRGDLYEYPLSDTIGYKDMGRKAQRFKVEGYLIGQDQIQVSRDMAKAAEDPEPSTLVHPIHGEKLVACVTLTMSADYKKDKKRTKLSFEFVEAKTSQAPSRVNESPDSVFNTGSDAVNASKDSNQWAPNTFDQSAAKEFSNQLGQTALSPVSSEQAWDARSLLERQGAGAGTGLPTFAQPSTPGLRAAPVSAPTARGARMSLPYASGMRVVPQTAAFHSIVDPIDYGAAMVRALYVDALERLKDYNAWVVQKTEQLAYSASVRSLVITTRLIIAREMAVAMTMRDYKTIKAALDDLDLIMAIYDEEEEEATRRCDDVLVAAIRRARAMAAEVILSRNIRKPGITEFPVDGLWPSLVVAQKLYANGQRYEEVENYNPTMLNFWIGRYCVAPAR